MTVSFLRRHLPAPLKKVGRRVWSFRISKLIRCAGRAEAESRQSADEPGPVPVPDGTERPSSRPAEMTMQYEPVTSPPELPARPESDRADARREILSRIETWLDDVLTQEQRPAGIPEEVFSQLAQRGPDEPAAQDSAGDLYALWSAMVALTQESKLQGRAFKQLDESLQSVGELPGHVAAALEAHRESLAAALRIAEQAREMQNDHHQQLRRAARREAQKEVLDGLLDLRDRLVRGRDSAEHRLVALRRPEKRGWLRRLLRRKAEATEHLIEATQALWKGYVLTVERLEETVHEFGGREIACRGLAFDPQRMTAVDVEVTAAAPEGTVLDVYRTGYEWQGKVYRPAEVKVSRRQAGAPDPSLRSQEVTTE